MKRNEELIKELLLEIEAHKEPVFNYDPLQGKFEDENKPGHLKLLLDEGLITGIDMSSKPGFQLANPELTTAGHNFLKEN